MNFKDWYTDAVDIYRVVQAPDGKLTRQERQLVQEGVPCRVYRTDSRAPVMEQAAAHTQEENLLACDNAVDIRPGDELHIYRGAVLGHKLPATRAFAGESQKYFEPFGAVIPGLAHQEMKLLQEERIDSLDAGGEGEGTGENPAPDTRKAESHSQRGHDAGY